MPSINSLVRKLQADHPTLSFAVAADFSWSPTSSTITYNPDTPHADALLLHEVSHALLGHNSYSRDVELLTIESAAWEKAKELATRYTVTITDDLSEEGMDSHRDWLHARSTCPNCNANGFQVSGNGYTCPACLHRWQVNEARICALRRYSVS